MRIIHTSEAAVVRQMRPGLSIKLAALLLCWGALISEAYSQKISSLTAQHRAVRNCLDPEITLNNSSYSVCQNSNPQSLGIGFSNPVNDPSTYSINWIVNPFPGMPSVSNAALTAGTIMVQIPAGTPAGTYSGEIMVSNAGGCSSPAYPFTLIIKNSPALGNDTTVTICSNSSINLNSLFSTSGLTVTWQQNGNAIGSPTAVNQAGTYSIIALNADGCADTAEVTVSITPMPSASLSYPSSVCSNTNPAVNPVFSGTTGGTFSGTAGLSINPSTGVINASASTGGNHTVTYSIPAGGGCPAFSISANITIKTPPSITFQPMDTFVCKFNTFSMSANATGFPATSVQWQVSTDGGASFSNISGANQNYYYGGVANSNQDLWIYQAVFTNECGTATTRRATLRVTAPLNPQDNPVSATGCAGLGTVTFFASGNGGNGQLGSVWQYSPDGGQTWIDIPSTWNYTNTGNISNTYTFTPTLSQNGYIFRLRFDNGRCPGSISGSATLTVNPIPNVDQPASQIVCAGNTVQPVNFSGTGNSYTWTNNNPAIGLAASGTGNIAFFTAVNNTNTVQTATITVTPIFTGGSPSVSCPGPTKTFTITVNPAATVNAGPSFTICQGGSLAISGSIGGSATSATWSAPSGTFSDINALSTVYTSAIGSGSVTLTLTTNDPDGPGPCLPVTSTTVISLSSPATVNAGSPQRVCSGSSITLAGSIGGSATSSTWTAPSGTFSNASALNSTYTPSITSGSVMLTLTTNDPAGPCPFVTSNVFITVDGRPTANAGSAQTTCSGAPITLAGSVGGSATGGTWSASSGSFSNPNALNSTYTPSITSGTVVLTLTTDSVPGSPCPRASATVTITVLANPVVTVTGTNVSCNGGTNGSASASATGSGNSFSWNTSPPQTGTSISNLPAGTYTVTATDNKGCRGTGSITITQPPPITLTTSQVNVNCAGTATGSASVSASGGTPGYTYSWNSSPVQTTGAAVNLPAGNYTVTVTDSKGCQKTASVTITQNPAIVLSETHTDVSCTGGNNGTVTIAATGGTAPYSGTGTFTGLSAGTYSFTVTDALGCSKTINVTIAQPAVLSLTETHINVSCNGGSNGSVTINASGGTAPYSGTGTFTGLAAGTYTYSVTDTKGCSKSITFTITQPAVLTAAETHANVNCFGASTGSVTITAGGGTSPYTGTGTFTGLSAGTYNYTVTDSKGCTATVTAVITQPTQITVSTTQTNVLCNGANNGTATVSVSGGTPGYTYSWSTSPAQTGATATNLAPGNYSVTVTDSKGCTRPATVTITQPAVLTLTETHTNVLCNGGTTGTVTINASGGTAPYTGTGTFNNLAAGSYTYTVTDANGCSKSISFTITQPSALTVTGTQINVNCNGGSNGSVTISASGGTAPYSGTGTFTGLSAGSYNYTVTDANGCSKSISFTITQPTPLTPAETHTNVSCFGLTNGTVTISATGGTAPYSGTGTFNNLAAGTYNYTISDSKGCSVTIQAVVTQPAALAVSISPNNVLCTGGNTGNATANVTGGTPNYTYSWNTSPVQTSATATNLIAGNYTVTVTDSKGCTKTATVAITQPTVLNVTETHVNVLCNGASTGSATINATGGTAPYTGTGTFTGLGAGTYNYTVTDANGCTKSINVIITQPAALTTSSTQVNVSCSGGSNGSVTISASGGATPYSGTGTFTGLSAGTYTYNVTDGNGCIKPVTFTITAPTPVAVTATPTAVLCNGGNTGTVAVTATGGTAPYTGTGTFTGLAAGTYFYTIIDSKGCSTTVQAQVSQPPALAATAIPANILCYGQPTGSVTVSATGGTPPYTGTGTFTGLAAGVYNYIVRDANNCSIAVSAEVKQPPMLTVSGLITSTSCNGFADGTVTISAMGGIPPYIGTGTYTGLAAGTYSYVITDANGCSKTFTPTISQPTPLVVTETHSNVNCNGGNNGTATITASGGTGPYSGTGLITGLTAGTHTFTVTDAKGCTATINVTITQPPAIQVSETHTNVLCNGGATGSATITASGGTGTLTGTGTFTGLAFGPHVFTVTDANGCQASITVNITQGTTLQANATQTNVSCHGGNNGSVTITATGGSTPYGGQGTFNNLQAGTYTYFVTDANGCSSFVNVTITQPDSLFIIPSITAVECFGTATGSVIISAQGGTGPYSGTGTFTGLTAGSYNYSITDSKGCTANTTAIITQPPALAATAAVTPVSCNGGSNGTVTITATGGTQPYSGTGTFTGLQAGTYTYNVTDASGCQTQVNFTIAQPAPLTASASPTPVSCFSGNNGSVIISATGGTQPYSGTGTFTGLSAGNYSYVITDANGCQTTVNFAIAQPTLLSASINSTPVSCFGGTDGTVTIAATGGTAPYSGTGVLTGISAGTYFYTVTDANGCTVPLSTSITSPTQLVLNENHTQILCNGGSDGTATISASGGTAPYTGTGVFTGLALGSHDFTVTDAKGCQKTITVNITQASTLAASETHNNVTCHGGNNGSAVITATGGTAPYTGTGTFTGLTAGSYNYTVTDANGCQSIVTVIITQPTAVSVSASPTGVSCNGGSNGSVVISASGGNMPYSGTGTFTGLNAGTYSYSVTDAAGCAGQTIAIITEPALLAATTSAQDALCNGGSTGSITITATGGTAPYSGTGTFTGLAAGTYNYTVTDSKGCTIQVSDVIAEPPALSLSETHTQILCNGGSDGTATISATGGTAPYTGTGLFTGLAVGPHDFTVIDANGCQQTITVNITQATTLAASETHTHVNCNGGNNGTAVISATGGTAPYTGTGTFTGLPAGTYNYTVSDANGCQSVVAVNISEPPALSASASMTNVSCYGGTNGSVTITASGGTLPYSGTGSFTSLSAGTYSYTVTDAVGCTAQAGAIISQPNALQASASSIDALCNGALDGSITVTAIGGTAPYTGTGTFTGLAAGTYNYTVTDANGCSSQVTDVVGEPPMLSLTETNTQILCNGGSDGTASISATGGTAPYTGTGSFTGLALGPHDFTVTDANGCQKTITVNITQATTLLASETHTNVNCNGGNNGTAVISASGGTAPYTGTGTFTGLTAGTHNYTVTDAAGCQAVVTVNITEPAAFIANASPTDVTCNGGSNGSVTVTASGGTLPYTGIGNFNGLSAGTYNYTVTDGNGCTGQTDAIISQPDILQASPAPMAALCYGSTTGSITVTASGGTLPYSGTGTFTGLAAGTYNYTVTDANGCSVQVTDIITEPAVLALSQTNTQILCNGGSDGTATIMATGGTAPYTGTGLFTGLAVGPHDFTVTDANGCQKTITVNITQATTLVASETHTNIYCNGGNNGAATISATGGTAPYTGTGTFSGLTAGTYNYTVTDAAGCQSVVTVNISEPSTLSATATPADVSCHGGNDGTITVTASGGTMPYLGTGTFSNLIQGNYNYTVTDANGCTGQANASINQPAALIPAISADDVICNGSSTGSITVTASGGIAPYSGTGTYTGLSAGIYSYTVSDANGCSANIQGFITEPDPLVLMETNTQILCNGGASGTATVSASGGTAPYTGTGLFTGLAVGPHDFTVTDANGCQKTITVNITQATTLVAAETHTHVNCSGGNNGTAVITATGGTAPYTGTGTFTGLTAGSYNYTVTDAAGCQAVATVVITEPSALSVNTTTTDVSCNGGSNGTVVVSASGGTLPYSGTGSFTGLNAGTYNYTVTDANGCTGQASAIISQPSLLAATASPVNTLCNGASNGSITVSASGGTAPYTGTGSFTGLAAGTYTYTVADANGCSVSIQGTVTEPAALSLSETNTQILCNGGASGTATISAAGGTAPYTGTGLFTGLAVGPHDFTVTDANGCQKTITVNITQATTLIAAETHTHVSCNGGNTGSAVITATGGTAPYTGTGNFTGLSAGTYNYTITDAAGCQAVATVNITEPSTLTATASATDVTCHGGSNGTITVSATGGTLPYSGTGTFTGLAAGTNNYTVTDGNGCTAQTTAVISQPTILTATATPTNALCNGASNGSVTVAATGGTAPYTGTGTFAGLAAGNNNYAVTDANGCTTTVQGIVTEPTALLLSETHTQIACNSGASGTATISATGGTAPYSGTGLFTGLTVGPHNFSVTDANGCQKTITVNITQATTLVAAETHNNVSCNGGNNGTAVITATGGTAPYSGTGTFTGLTAGTYNYTTTDAAGCQAVATVTITEPSALSVNTNTTDVSCNGGSNGTVIVSAAGGTLPYSGTGNFTGLNAGTYNYTVTDANGCTGQASAIISQPSLLAATATPVNTLCNGASNGSITVSASGGTAPYAGTGTFMGLAAGNYNYAVTDANGCTTTVQGIVTEPTALLLSETHTQIACNSGASGTATISATGGTAPYSGTGLFTGLTVGPHNFTVTDANGCQKTITVNITQATTLVAAETHNNVSCNGGNNGSAIITATGGTGPYTGTGTFPGLAAGSYNFTVTDAAGCQSVITVNITEPLALMATASATDVSCHGGSNGTITVSATGGTLPYSGTGTFTGLAAGTNNYTVTDGNGCTAQTTAVILQPTILTATATPTNALCNGASNGSVTVAATGGTSPYTGTGTFTGLAAGNYNYAVTDANGCTANIQGIVTEPAAMILSETHTNVACGGGNTGTATITASGGNAPYSGTGTFQGLGFGAHQFSVTDANGCQKTITVNIAQNTSLQATETHTDISCAGLNNGSITIAATGGTAPYSGTGTFTGLSAGNYNYVITDNAGCSSLVNVTIIEPVALTTSVVKTNVLCYGESSGTVTVTAAGGTAPYNGTGSFTGLSAGTYSYTVTDANGCTAAANAVITQPSPLQANSNHVNPICSNPLSGSITITASGGTPPYEGTGVYTGLGSGSYTYTISDDNDCDITVNVPLALPDTVNLIINNPAAACTGSTVDITLAAITAGSSSGLNISYWMDAAGTVPLSNPQAISTAGTYYIKAMNGSGCSKIMPVTISFKPLPSGTIAGGGTICAGSTQNLSVLLTGSAPFSLTYSDGSNNNTISGINSTNYQMTVSPAATTTYTLVSVSDAGCSGTGNSSAATVTVTPSVAGVRYPNVTTSINTPTPLTARNLGAGYSYDWNPGFGLNSYNSMSTTFSYDQTVEYTIRMTNASGCDVTDTVKVIVEGRSQEEKSGIWVPNAWSPNGSGKNDLLRPLCLNIAEIRFFRVFNRWGQLMFETSRIGEGWNGIWKGKAQVGDVYTWTLEAYGIEGKKYFKSGNSILLR